MPPPDDILTRTQHRQYPLPEGPWVLSMSWHDLLFMHWPISAEKLWPLIPPTLRLDTFDGSAWLGVVPFRMSGVRPRFLPGISRVSDFPELNLRTYVSADGKPGIWFFSLDAHNPVAVRIARATFKLPYYDARMSCRTSGGSVFYDSARIHRNAPPARFRGAYRPTGETFESRSGTLEDFLTERYCLYAADARGTVRRGDIHHEMWPLQTAEADTRALDMTSQIGVKLPDTEPLLHFARRLDVVAWPPERISS